MSRLGTPDDDPRHTDLVRHAGLVALGGAALTVAGVALVMADGFLAPPEEIAAAAADDTGRLLTGTQLGVLGAVLLMAFAALLRRRLAAVAPDSALPTMAGTGLLAGSLSVALGLACHGSIALRADEDGAVAGSSAAAIADLGGLAMGGIAPAALGLTVFATSLVATRHRAVLPFWLASVGFPLAAALVVLPVNWAVAPVGLLWIAAAGMLVSYRPRPVAGPEPVLGAIG